MSTSYRFSVGPWNLSEGRDPYGPETRPALGLPEKIRKIREGGFDSVMFHDDDIIPDIDSKSTSLIMKEAREVRKLVENEGLGIEMVAPRLWFSPHTIDGGFTSNAGADRDYALTRSLQAIDIAAEMGTDLLVLWLAREGTYIRESKSAAHSLKLLVGAVNKMLQHNPKIRIAIEPKPNEPVDMAYLPTAGHVLAFSHLTDSPARVGCVIETAHCILAGLDPVDELDFALAQNKLWSIHLNDQNGLKFDQDKPFGSVNLRSAFGQVMAIERHQYGSKDGACIAFDTHAFRTSDVKNGLDHAINSKKTFHRLLEKARSFDAKLAGKLVAARDYQALDQLVLDHLLG